MPTITVRPPAPNDAAAIGELSDALGYPATTADIGARLQVLAEDPSQCIRVATRHDGTVLGWAHAARQVLLESGVRCELLGLVTAAGARGTGVGRALVEAVEAWARDHALPLVSLRCNVIRTEAHGFYEHLGYQRAKTQHAFRKALIPAASTWPMA
jgi:GNAT superfamily N-acetyltransferase